VATSNRQYVFLGYPITIDSPNPPAIPAVEISPLYRLAQSDTADVSLIKLASHTGTHLDVPAHVVEGGFTLSEFGPEEFVFDKPVVLDFQLGDCELVEPRHLEPILDPARDADLLLCRFGYGPVRRTDPARYSSKCPGFGVASAEYLLENLPNLRAIGMDVPSLACIEHLDETMAAHNALLGGEGRRFLVIEDMNLEHDLTNLTSVWVAPLLVAGLDGAPCTVIGILNE
jgi:kynurenine formamidase